MTPEAVTLDVVVPTLDEERCLPALLEDLDRLDVSHRVLVVDGGSCDRTVAIARAAGVETLSARRGRAWQLRAGAEATQARWLLFLHADCRLPEDARTQIRAFCEADDPISFAHFCFQILQEGWFWRFIELGQGLRERLWGLVYGDQALLVSREAYRDAGGYPEWPILEDVGIVERLLARGYRRVGLPARLPTSPRRYERDGRWRSWLENTALIGAYRAGMSPERLAELSRRTAEADAPPRRGVVAVFARAPRPGAVKARLAAGVGAERAAELYRVLGARVVAACRGHPIVVFHDPPGDDARAEARAWLGADLEYRAQEPGDLGARMDAAVRACLRGADRVCVVGTDVHGMEPGHLHDAFAALDRADVVLGPAADGGYWLIGLKACRPDLFRDVPWSTDAVLETTLERARAGGLRVELLATLRDIDVVDDVPAELRDAVRR